MNTVGILCGFFFFLRQFCKHSPNRFVSQGRISLNKERLFFELLEYDAGVVAAETQRIGKCDADRLFLGFIGDVI